MKEIDPPDQSFETGDRRLETGDRKPETGEQEKGRSPTLVARIETAEWAGGFAVDPCRHEGEAETIEGSEAMLRFLDAEISMQRARKKAPSRNRALFIVSGLLFIVAAAAAALMVLEEMLSSEARDGRGSAQSQTGMHPGGGMP